MGEGGGMLDQITQVAMLVSDIRKATNFYSYVLGLPIVTKSDQVTEFRTEGVILSVKNREPRTGGGSAQLTFQVHDLDVAFSEAKQRGGKVLTPPRTVEGGRVAQIADPDGNVVELFEPEA